MFSWDVADPPSWHVSDVRRLLVAHEDVRLAPGSHNMVAWMRTDMVVAVQCLGVLRVGDGLR